MPTTNISFAKIVATPTSQSWSQAYNAGGLFIVLSLATEDEVLQKELPTHGKQMLSNLEAEFFGLEEKNFQTIQKAITDSLPKLPEEIIISLSLAFTKDDTLFAFVLGNGRITLKRLDRIGIILESLTATDRTLHSSSGYLEQNDLILIQTASFAESVPAKTIIEALDNTLPNDIAETISPSIHGGSEGGASAIILSYKGISHTPDNDDTLLPASHDPLETTIPSSEKPVLYSAPLTTDDETVPAHRETTHRAIEGEDDEEQAGIMQRLKSLLPTTSMPKIILNRQKKLILAITCILIGLLIMSIFLVQKNGQSSKDHALFDQTYTSAKKDYDEGEGLLSLNKSLAHDDYISAKKTLDTVQGKFKPGSSEATQINDLTALVDKRLADFSDSSQATAKEVGSDTAPILAALAKDSSVTAATGEDTTVYTISNKGISKDGQTVVKNDSDWASAKALGVFSGNLYVLDPKNGLLKFVPAANDYAKSTYFKGDSPDLKTAVSMAIDSSIYILFSDGSVQKYTRGTKDSFTISGLSKTLSNPMSIYTSPDVQNLYILDPSNTRIVKLDKTGAFSKEYASSQLKSATALTISKDEKSAFFLAGGKIYQVSL